MFSKVTLGNLEACRTEVEISDQNGDCVAVIYEADDGLHVEQFRTMGADEKQAFDSIVQTAKNDLSHYVNRKGLNAPKGLTVAGMSLWLLQKDDGTALGINVADLDWGKS